ncbi:hypothetical protein BC937DRAFT_93430 [Endogone sp. FLAS-F59071]|nr:hypothetical protein BC937DRAFT_93430 [Endogone sp. FLAS-F59071]|eukprot:RUS14720.1 hypothetical protein BC937DRAFT_93430 [Endogone sp. FLAS-F59071]
MHTIPPPSPPSTAPPMRRTTSRWEILLLVCLCVLVLCPGRAAADLFSSSGPSVHQDVIYLSTNSTNISNVTQLGARTDYTNNVLSTDNISDPVQGGIMVRNLGVLYDRGLSCQPDQSSATAVPPGVPKIALIARGDCYFQQKLHFAQIDGAVGAIVFDNISFANDTNGVEGMGIAAGTITIPAYYVDNSVGLDLLSKLALYDKVTNASVRTMVRVIMYPPQNSVPGAWEFTLIVVVVLLAISFLTSVAMHLHLWLLRRRQRLMLEQGLIPPGSAYALHMMLKVTVDPDVLETFPVRVIGAPNSATAASPGVEEPGSTSAPTSVEAESTTRTLHRSPSTKSVRSVKAVENAEAVAKGLRRTQSTKSLRASKVEGAAAQETDNEEICVICLDEYEQGERVRKLVCGHEYHCECIDPWLMQVTASCPLCKHDCSHALDDQGREVDKPQTNSEVAIDMPEPAAARRNRWPWARGRGTETER